MRNRDTTNHLFIFPFPSVDTDARELMSSSSSCDGVALFTHIVEFLEFLPTANTILYKSAYVLLYLMFDILWIGVLFLSFSGDGKIGAEDGADGAPHIPEVWDKSFDHSADKAEGSQWVLPQFSGYQFIIKVCT